MDIEQNESLDEGDPYLIKKKIWFKHRSRKILRSTAKKSPNYYDGKRSKNLIVIFKTFAQFAAQSRALVSGYRATPYETYLLKNFQCHNFVLNPRYISLLPHKKSNMRLQFTRISYLPAIRRVIKQHHKFQNELGEEFFEKDPLEAVIHVFSEIGEHYFVVLVNKCDERITSESKVFESRLYSFEFKMKADFSTCQLVKVCKAPFFQFKDDPILELRNTTIENCYLIEDISPNDLTNKFFKQMLKVNLVENKMTGKTMLKLSYCMEDGEYYFKKV